MRVFIFLMLTLMVLIGCGDEQPTEQDFKDQQAMEDGYSYTQDGIYCILIQRIDSDCYKYDDSEVVCTEEPAYELTEDGRVEL